MGKIVDYAMNLAQEQEMREVRDQGTQMSDRDTGS
jgi:hypothetical protein